MARYSPVFAPWIATILSPTGIKLNCAKVRGREVVTKQAVQALCCRLEGCRFTAARYISLKPKCCDLLVYGAVNTMPCHRPQFFHHL